MKTKIIGIIGIAFIIGLMVFDFTKDYGTCNYDSGNLLKYEISSHYHGSDDSLKVFYEILDDD
jgi:hypothetical protein